uniref:SNF-related serine/threonine-protein kinase n=1 Tax=Neolamprologus brichardi TaxID=32507 RepID=A0A3Q4GP21_NEOBR
HTKSQRGYYGLYHLGRTLGRGHFAVVKLGRNVNTGQLVAVKMIDKTKLDVMATSHLLQEVRCMRRVQHPNVVRLYEVIDTPTTLYLVMELAEGGDLYDYILRHEGGVAEVTAKRHFAQIVRAVSYCHQLHVVHRDLKPENVVFFPQQGAVKLTDFGFSNLFQPGMMLATSCGSLAYSAPEILLGEEYDAPAVDIWSLGVILYMLVCGVPPFQETNDSETLVMILDCRYSIPEHVSDECRDLISRMLQKDPSRRSSLDEIEAHHWLQGLDNALLSPEAPPHWLSGALSPSSPHSGVPECGDLLAARPSSEKPFPAPWQPSLMLFLLLISQPNITMDLFIYQKTVRKGV